MSSASNRFAALNNPALSNPRDLKPGNGNTSASSSFAGIDRDNLVKDLSTEKPQWILSCYGPGRNAPEQLFGGPTREFSFEEMRLKHYMSPNPQQTAQEFETIAGIAEQQMQNALDDLDGAIKFLMDAQNKHPNRIDIVDAINASHQVANPVNPILNPTAAPNAGAFGAPQSNNAFGSTSASNNAFGGSGGGGGGFGKPAFGAPAAPISTGAFGQPSMLGAKPNPFSSNTPSAFGQPSALGGSVGSFGQPSALGQKPNPFASTTPAPFGQAPSSNPPPFGQTPASSAPSGFSAFAGGAPNGFSSSPVPNPFVQNTAPAFGQPSLPSTTLNPPTGPSSMNGFAQPNNTFGQPTSLAPPTGPSSNNAPNLFSQGNNAFGQPANPMPQQPAFGQSAFGQPALGFNQPASGFSLGQNTSQPQNQNLLLNPNSNTNANPFGAPSSASNLNPFSKPTPQQTPENNTFGAPAFSSQNQQQQKKPQNSKTLFPDGPPPPYPATEESEELYDADVRKMWEGFKRLGAWEFDGGVMPMVAPKREWCSWDF